MKTSFPGMTVSLAPTWPIAGNPENPLVHDSLRANGGPERAARIAYSEIRPRSFAQAPSKDREQVSGAMDRG